MKPKLQLAIAKLGVSAAKATVEVEEIRLTFITAYLTDLSRIPLYGTRKQRKARRAFCYHLKKMIQQHRTMLIVLRKILESEEPDDKKLEQVNKRAKTLLVHKMRYAVSHLIEKRGPYARANPRRPPSIFRC